METDNCPLIGITTYGRNNEGGFSLPTVYIDCIRRAGGIALLVPPGESQLKNLVDQLDGVILAGGGDINPTRYQGNLHETIYNVDDERDISELKLAETALEANMPILAICRGLQIFNILLGGNLYEHLPEIYGESILHRAPPRVPINHKVTIDQGSQLFTIFQKPEIEVASWHHQALKNPASSFTIVARSADGVTEAAEIESNPSFLGVQWHPELTAKDDLLQQRLFDDLVLKSRKFASHRKTR